MRTGTQCHRANFVARFRLAAREYIGHQNRLAKLGPQYFSCNDRQTSCTRTKAEPRKGCPTCEYTIQSKKFHAELLEKLNRLPRTTRRGMRLWSPKKMYATVQEVASVAASTKGTSPKWPVPLAVLVMVYRDELGKINAIKSLQLAQEAESNAAKQREKQGGPRE